MDKGIKTFQEWCNSYDDFEMFVGVNKMSHRDVARLAWDYRLNEIVHLQDQNKIIREALLFYADIENNTKDGEGKLYGFNDMWMGNECWTHDQGNKAKEALKQVGSDG